MVYFLYLCKFLNQLYNLVQLFSVYFLFNFIQQLFFCLNAYTPQMLVQEFMTLILSKIASCYHATLHVPD